VGYSLFSRFFLLFFYGKSIRADNDFSFLKIIFFNKTWFETKKGYFRFFFTFFGQKLDEYGRSKISTV
jgi:hypothetical protein